MKKTIITLILLLGISLLTAQQNLFIDCVHGTDRYFDTGISQEIDFQSYFPEYNITVFTAENVALSEVLLEEDQLGVQNLIYSVTLPEASVPHEPIALYVIITNNSGELMNFATGTAANPQGEIVAEMANSLLHYDGVEEGEWTIDLHLTAEENYHIKIGYGPVLFGSPEFTGQYSISNYDAILRIKDHIFFPFAGMSPDYSEYDFAAIEEAFESGIGFMNIHNYDDSQEDKPFIHFETEENVKIDFELSLPGMRTIVKPAPIQEKNHIRWENFDLIPNSYNEIIYEAVLDSKLNFLDFQISGKNVQIQNQVSYPLNNLKLFRYLGNGNYEFSQVENIPSNGSKTISSWEIISTQDLKRTLKSQFYNEALQQGLKQDEADHFVNDFIWIESLLRRALDNPEHYFGLYRFSGELYDKLNPYLCNPQPENVSRNMWVMISNIQNREKENIISFPQPVSSNDKNIRTADIEMREYGIVDEYYSRKNNSREDEFFGIEWASYINGWMAEDLLFYDNETANIISENIVALNPLAGFYTYEIENTDAVGILYESSSNLPLCVSRQIGNNGQLIALGSTGFFNDFQSNVLFLNNCINYLITNSASSSENFTAVIPDVQAFPNPFNPTTTIQFSVSRKDAKDAIIEIYNIKGQKIKTFLLDCHPGPVEGSIVWDGTDEEGNIVSSGVYFYKLKVNDQMIDTKKMVMIK
jgi:hypothetical protein